MTLGNPLKFKHDPKALRSETTLMPWLIWFLAVLFYAFEFLQRVSISVYLPHLISDLKTDATAIGIMGSCYYYAYASMQIPAGVLIDWLGAKRLATLGIALVSVGAFLFSTIHGVTAGSMARILMGLGSAFAFVCVMKLIILWFPPSRFAILAGLTNLAGYLGATMGETPLTYVVKNHGWRFAAASTALIGLVIMVLIAFFVKDKPYSHAKAKKKPKIHKAPSIFHGLKQIIRIKESWFNGLYGGLMVGPTSAFAALWGVSFFTQVDHITSVVAATALSVIFIGVALGSPCFGFLSDYFGSRRKFLLIAAVGSLIASSCLIYLNHIPLSLIFLFCFLFGFFQSAHVLNFAIAKDISTRKTAGAAMGFTNMIVMIGGAILQPVIGFLLDWTHHVTLFQHGPTLYSHASYHEALFVIPLFQAMAFIIAAFFIKDHSHPPPPGM